MTQNGPMRGTYGAFVRRHRLDALPISAFVLLGVVAWVPWLFAFPYLFQAHPQDHFQGTAGLGGILGGPGANWWRNRRYWRLDRASRRVVMTVTRTGLPSGQSALDKIAEGRLSQAAEMKKSSPVTVRLVVTLMAAVFVAVPIVAAVRSSPWWLCASWPVVALLAVRLSFRTPEPEDPRTRLDGLRASYGHQDIQ